MLALQLLAEISVSLQSPLPSEKRPRDPTEHIDTTAYPSDTAKRRRPLALDVPASACCHLCDAPCTPSLNCIYVRVSALQEIYGADATARVCSGCARHYVCALCFAQHYYCVPRGPHRGACAWRCTHCKAYRRRINARNSPTQYH